MHPLQSSRQGCTFKQNKAVLLSLSQNSVGPEAQNSNNSTHPKTSLPIPLRHRPTVRAGHPSELANRTQSSRAGHFQQLHQLHVLVYGVLLLHAHQVKGGVPVLVFLEALGPLVNQVLHKLPAPIASGVVQGRVAFLILSAVQRLSPDFLPSSMLRDA